MINNKIFLLTSGAYANPEISSDFGKLPTSFLPVGHKRLFDLQLDLIDQIPDLRKVISLPLDYKLLKKDKQKLIEKGVEIFYTNPVYSLNKSLLNFIGTLPRLEDIELYILHGDTLFSKIDLVSNEIYFGYTNMFYSWGDLEEVISEKMPVNEFGQAVVAGYFSFDNLNLLKQELENELSFEKTLRNYHAKNPFKLVCKEDWLDFGHSNLYYKSKMNLNVTRNFNKNEVRKNYINKSSSKISKIESEYKWFTQIPENLKIYIPNVWGYSQTHLNSSYNIEFVGAPTLQEKWVFGDLPDYTYYNVLDKVFEYIQENKSVKFLEISNNKTDILLQDLYINKTTQRIKEFCDQLSFDENSSIVINQVKYPSLKQLVNDVLSDIQKYIKIDAFTIMHGDLCFSNIFFDSRSNIIKVIDPRGGLDDVFNSEHKTIGDYRYDIAKLGHSIVGNYDYIVTGYYELEYDIAVNEFKFSLNHKNKPNLEKYFYNKANAMGVDTQFIKASIVNLFISMLPLHDEDVERQLALLVNAFLIYYKI